MNAYSKKRTSDRQTYKKALDKPAGNGLAFRIYKEQQVGSVSSTGMINKNTLYLTYL